MSPNVFEQLASLLLPSLGADEEAIRLWMSVLLVAMGAALLSPEVGKLFHILWALSARLVLMVRTKLALTKDSNICVSELRIHPVKSCRKVLVPQVQLDEKGLGGDRRFVICAPAPTPLWGHFRPEDATHRFVTQRQCPTLARIQASLSEDKLTLSCDLLPLSRNSITVSLTPPADAAHHRVTLWDDVVASVDMGDDVARFLQRVVEKDDDYRASGASAEVRLVTQSDSARRTDDRYVPAAARTSSARAPPVAMQDGFAVLIASEASLKELNRRLEERSQTALPMDRFRPNIVVAGDDLEPFEEDEWKIVEIDGIIFHVVKGCERCKQTCTDQLTGVVAAEPLATLATFRAMRSKGDVYFAQNAIPAPGSSGKMLKVGAKVRVIARGQPQWSKS